jgi:LasA protease
MIIGQNDPESKPAGFGRQPWCSLESKVKLEGYGIPPKSTNIPIRPSPRPPGLRPSPTADAPQIMPTLRIQPTQVIVAEGDTLKNIARRFQVSLMDLITANNLLNPDLLQIGQTLIIPPQSAGEAAPSFKIIPDSELVYGPYAASFDVNAFVVERGGGLAAYQEDVDGIRLGAAEIITRVAREVSINPRLLLALLEYQGGWLTRPVAEAELQDYPLGFVNPERRGLYHQLSWAAGELSRGYYLWQVHGIGLWILKDGSTYAPSPVINAGTAGVQELFAELYGKGDWERAISAEGLYQTYTSLFGDAFDNAFDALLPPELEQPQMQLPFEPGVVWAFTGGPHGGWSSETGWAALDFAPPADDIGCQPSNDWVTAVADGLIVFSQDGAVIQDLDGDGYWQTGWSVLYMHVEGRDRVGIGSMLQAGERIGHPSCEGGISTGTHVHVARRYNGVWISADGNLPFVLDDWVSTGAGIEYEGTLQKGAKILTAFSGRNPENEIVR